MKWTRIAPGQYKLRRDDITIALVERSNIFPWVWWWSAWDEHTDESGTDCKMLLAKASAEKALARSACA